MPAGLKLTRRQYTVCIMRIGTRGRRSQREIARRLRISQPTVAQHLAAAVRKYPPLAPLLLARQGRPAAA